MDWTTTLALFAVVLASLMALGVWMPVALGGTGVVLLLANGNLRYLESVGSIFWTQGSNFVLLAIPLFIFMGEIVLVSGVSDRFYRSISPLCRFIPGGLYNTNIVASALFAAVSGSSVATAAALGNVSLPELRERGYDDRLSFGTLAVGGTLGILIPPSGAMIIYGSLVDENIAHLFMAGLLPGLLIVALCIAYIVAVIRLRPHLAPTRVEKMSILQMLRLSAGALPLVCLILLVIGGLYGGYVTPTEAAGLGVLGALVIAGSSGRLTLQLVRRAVLNTVTSTCMLMFVILGAQIVAFALARLGVTRELTDWVIANDVGPWTMLLIVVALYLILGCLMDAVSMMVMTVPLIYPIMMQLGFDSVWLGVVLVLLMEIGLITPPVGLNLFVLQGISGRPIGEVARGALPFVVLLLLGILLITVWPGIALWLPSQL